MSKQKVIITGGSGFVGRWLQQELGEYDLTIWDYEQGIDITDPATYEASLKETQSDWLVHLAAVTTAGEARQDPAKAGKTNTEAVEVLLQKIKELSPQTKVLAVSSADIYGSGSLSPIPELSLEEAHPANPYAQSKWDMEKLIEQKFNDFVIRVRPFPHIGPGQRQGFVTADFASQIARIEKGSSPILKVGNLEAQRDFTDVRDVVRAYRLLLEKGKTGEVYHVASGKAVAIQDVLDQLLSLSTAKISVEQDPTKMRPSDTPILVGDASKLKNLTGWEATIPLQQSLKDVLNYWREKA